MTMARVHLVDVSITRWYHGITRSVRRVSPLGEVANDRKHWIENRPEELAQIFSTAFGGFGVLDNQLL